MGVDSADYDGDGHPDLLVTHFAQDHSTLYHGKGGLYYEDVSAKSGLSKVTYKPLSWGCYFLDYDNNGKLDIFIANGHIYPQVDQITELEEAYAQAPLLLEQRQLGMFTDVTAEHGPGLASKRSMLGLAVGDVDNDGDLDVLISAIESVPLLLRNDGGNANRWLSRRLLDAATGSDALNIRETITASGMSEPRALRSGSN